jgi:hypothetical protein
MKTRAMCKFALKPSFADSFSQRSSPAPSHCFDGGNAEAAGSLVGGDGGDRAGAETDLWLLAWRTGFGTGWSTTWTGLGTRVGGGCCQNECSGGGPVVTWTVCGR